MSVFRALSVQRTKVFEFTASTSFDLAQVAGFTACHIQVRGGDGTSWRWPDGAVVS
jgi:hypothetical protein